MGQLRRTDWLPVGKDIGGNEQLRRSCDSESSDSADDPENAFDSQHSSDGESTADDIQDSAHSSGSSSGNGGINAMFISLLDDDLENSVAWRLAGSAAPLDAASLFAE